MRSVLAWVLHALVLAVLLSGIGAFAGSVGATGLVGMAAVTAVGVALSGFVTVLLLRLTGAPRALLAARLLPVPALLAALTAGRVVGAGGGVGDVALALAAWVLGAAGAVVGGLAAGRLAERRRTAPGDWSLLR